MEVNIPIGRVTVREVCVIFGLMASILIHAIGCVALFTKDKFNLSIAYLSQCVSKLKRGGIADRTT